MDDKSSSHCLSIASRVGWASCKIGWMAYITSSPLRSGPEEKLSNEQLPTYVPSLAVRHHNDSCGLGGRGPVENVWSCFRKSFFFPNGSLDLGGFFPSKKKRQVFSMKTAINSDVSPQPTWLFVSVACPAFFEI